MLFVKIDVIGKMSLLSFKWFNKPWITAKIVKFWLFYPQQYPIKMGIQCSENTYPSSPKKAKGERSFKKQIIILEESTELRWNFDEAWERFKPKYICSRGVDTLEKHSNYLLCCMWEANCGKIRTNVVHENQALVLTTALYYRKL